MSNDDEETPKPNPELERMFAEFQGWDDETKAEVARKVKEAQDAQWRPFFCPNPLCDGMPHTGDGWTFNHARSDQRLPPWMQDWLTTLIMSGRGSGKTRTGSENTHRVAKRVPRIALVGVTNAAVKNVMIEGESGLLRTANPAFAPIWSPSKMQLMWPNGSIAQCYSAEEPDRLRGANNAFAWLDEAAFMPNIDDVWMNLLLTLRVKDPKNPNHILVTTTPTPTEWIKALAADPKTVLRRVSTYANKANLSETFWNKITAEFEGTRMGRQELHGEILDDVVGALWQSAMLRVLGEHDVVPAMQRILVSIDPAGSTDKKSDATGIVAVGLGHDGRFYVLDDATDIYSPAEWANKAIELAKKYKADAIVAEKNYGGDMVRYTLESQLGAHQQQFRIMLVESRRGKDLRAEPIVGLYEKELVWHVRGLQKLEAEQLSWVPGVGRSPNRVDALVHGLTELSRRMYGGAILRGPFGIDAKKAKDISEPEETPMDVVRRKVPGIKIPGATEQGVIMQRKRGRIVVR